MKTVLFSLIEDPTKLLRILRRHTGVDEIEVVQFTDLGFRSTRKWLTCFRKTKPDLFVLGIGDVRTQQNLKFWKLVCLRSGAKAKAVVDERGKITTLHIAKYLCIDGPELVAETVLTALAVCGFYGLLLLLNTGYGLKRLKERTHPSGKLKVAFLRTNFWFGYKAGGSVAHIAGFLSGLNKLNVDVFCVSTDVLFGVDRTCVPMFLIYPWSFFNTFPETPELMYNVPFVLHAHRILKREKPTVIYQRYSAYNFSGAILARLFRIPFVLEFNSSEIWKSKHWSKKYLMKATRLVETLNLQAADQIVVVSQALKDDLIEFGIESDKILVNPNGVDPNKFSDRIPSSKIRRKFGIASEEMVVGFSGTFGVWHGIPVLAESIVRILKQRKKLRFLLIGDGKLRKDLEERIIEAGVCDGVILTGTVPYSEIQDYLSACDILVSPHTPQPDGKEFFGSPTKLFEYMAMGKAIVASDLGQIGEIIEDRVNGLKVTPGSVEALVEAILILAEDEGLRLRLGKQARKDVVEKYTWRSNARRVMEEVRNMFEKA